MMRRIIAIILNISTLKLLMESVKTAFSSLLMTALTVLIALNPTLVLAEGGLVPLDKAAENVANASLPPVGKCSLLLKGEDGLDPNERWAKLGIDAEASGTEVQNANLAAARRAQALAQAHALLVMIGESPYRFSAKALEEKYGELILGVPILGAGSHFDVDGKTLLIPILELTYGMANRGQAPPVMFLKSVSLITPYLKKIELSKEPIVDHGEGAQLGAFKSPGPEYDDVMKAIGQLAFPIRINEAQTAMLRRAERWLPNVSPAELQKYGPDGILRLEATGIRRGFLSFLVKKVPWQITKKAAFFIGIFALTAYVGHGGSQNIFVEHFSKGSTVENIVGQHGSAESPDILAAEKLADQQVLSSRLIDANEKVWLAKEIAASQASGHDHDHASTTANARPPAFDSHDFKYQSSDDGVMWALHVPTKEVYVFSVAFAAPSSISDSEARAGVPVGIQFGKFYKIPPDLMPNTHAKVLNSFAEP